MNKLSIVRDGAGRSEVRPQRDIADGARHPRVIWAVGESEGQARNRLTGIRTRGSPGPDKVAPVIWGMDVFVSRRSWLSWGQVLDLMQEGNVCALRLRRSAALTHHTTAV
jgi:hypothetical protein